jgi:uncharacterized membrane protein
MTLPQLPRWRYALAYLLAAVTFLALDGVWLTATTASIYRPALGHLMAADVVWMAAVFFYVIYFAGLVFFAVEPALTARRPLVALARGAALGLMCYATYDLTNQATLRDWPWHVTGMDLVWGAVNSGVSSFVAAAVTQRALRKSAPA